VLGVLTDGQESLLQAVGDRPICVGRGRAAATSPARYWLKLPYVVAIRATHPVWMFPGARNRYTRWRPYHRVFADGTTGTSERRYLREIVFARRTPTRYYHLTTDPVRQPEETTWYLKTNLPGKIERSVGNTFGLRTQNPNTGSSRPRTSWAGPTIA
jgi:SRSO17 transposase